MRILQIVPSISLVYGGPSQMVMGLSTALTEAGVEITVLTTNSNGDAGQPPLDVPLNQPIPQNGYEIIYFRCHPFRRYKFSLDLLKWLWIHGKEYDLAHIHALFSPISTAAARVAKYQNLPYILRPLGTLDPADLRKKRRLKQVYATLLERHNLAGAAGIHFTSDEEARTSERFGTSTRDFIIPLGVLPQLSSEKIPLQIPTDRPLVLFLSRIEPKKGLDLLIPALETLLETLNFHFILAGSNPQNPKYERKIQEQIQASPLGKITTITGFVTGDLKASLLQNADLFVLPSYYENFGIAVAEAMVAGTSVVISNKVQIWEDIQQAEAGWVTSCEVEDLTETLREALANSSERQRRGRKGKEFALEHYSWKAIAQQTIQAYETILNTKFRNEHYPSN